MKATLTLLLRNSFTALVFFVVFPGFGRGQNLSFTDDFSDGIGHPGTFGADGEWDNGDFVDGQIWIIPMDADPWPGPGVGAKRDTSSMGGTGNNIAGRLRALESAKQPGGAANSAVAAIDVTIPLDIGSLSISAIGDGTSRTGFKIRLLNESGTPALEVVVQNSAPLSSVIEASQVNAGTFVNAADDINWAGGVGANIVINFDVRTDTFDATFSDTGGSGPIVLSETAFDNAVDRIARFELECFLANGAETNIGSEVSFERIALTGAKVIENINLTQVQVGETIALEFLSEIDVTYRLDSTTDLVSSNNYTDTGAYAVGNGANMLVFDPAGFSADKAYRIRVSPTDLLVP